MGEPVTLWLIAALVAAGLYVAWRLRRAGRIEAERDALADSAQASNDREAIHGEVVTLPDDALAAELSRWMRRDDGVLGVEGDPPERVGPPHPRDG